MNLRLTSSRASAEPLPIPLHVILGSQSVGRKNLLEKLGVRFRVVVTRVDEDTISAKDPYLTIKKRAEAKLEEILKHPRVYMLDEKAQNLVIAADSMAVLGKKAFGKSVDREDTKAILKALMGKTHVFATAVAIAMIEQGGQVIKRWDKMAKTKVTFRKMSAPEVESYAARYDFTRFAGGYALNEAPWDLITKVDGSYTNVIGLPFEHLLPIFRSLNIII